MCQLICQPIALLVILISDLITAHLVYSPIAQYCIFALQSHTITCLNVDYPFFSVEVVAVAQPAEGHQGPGNS